MGQRPFQKNERTIRHRNAMAISRTVKGSSHWNQRTRGIVASRQTQFLPPEEWHEPSDSNATTYRIVRRDPGDGFRHVVTPADIRQRLAQLPSEMLQRLEVVHLSRMTRKKRTFPCYGMQWGASLYLYPIEESLVEHFDRPPRPQVFNEARMFGGRWEQSSAECWRLVWTEDTIRDFYLNNILIHELGHLLDQRNRGYVDRERYAEWFAIRHGYKTSERSALVKKLRQKGSRRRHHKK